MSAGEVTRPTPLPAALEVRELLEGLLGRDVEGTVGTPVVDPHKDPGAVVGVYVDDLLKLRAIVVMEMPLAAYTGAAIALIPARTAQDSVEAGLISPMLFDNTTEILNVGASLFNHDGCPHLRLYETYAPRETLPADIDKWVLAYVQRLDMELDVTGYGKGNISVLVV
ncbi:hypothetical protein J4G33_05720 [Actinotalea sp. BY-33]|uniref:Uncharacterized protein n=1 Tax=Actinotalea soli TaxID=2819234 RepID=A0A939RSH5_9CELL|nr:hypothetical protein [Actinotalea soli]MBO1751297.1 hypothetical protein [Actinotalea soli]